MVRLDAELLARVPSVLNPLKDRELDLRAIENLGVTRDALDALDLTDNSITSLSNFPLLRRLQHIYLSSNPLRVISPSVPTSLPNLRTLILTNTAIPKESLGQVGEVLGRCKRLEQLSLKGTPVSEEKYYREWIVWKSLQSFNLLVPRAYPDYFLPSPVPFTHLVFHSHLNAPPLPFPSPSPLTASLQPPSQDRALSKSLFLTSTGSPTPLALSLIAAAAATTTSAIHKTFEPGTAGSVEVAAVNGSGKAGRLLSKEEKERVRAAIEGAESVEEIRRLQRMLAQGFVPTEKDLKDLEKKKKGGAADVDAMEQD
ncbi:U2 small nuclear ribonucleoprotein A', partial [Phenoliferia sp. Uapishka_3]